MGDSGGGKRCPRCDRELERSDFDRNSAARDGLQSWCRSCRATIERRRPRKLAPRPSTGPDEKWCRRCERVKPRSAFGVHAKTNDGLQSYCRECFAAIYRQKRIDKGHKVRPADVPPGSRYCRSCDQVLPQARFRKTARGRDGLHFRCMDCDSRAGRLSHLARQYGLTPQAVEDMLAAQGGLCAICEVAEAVHVDHCHDSGRIRGLLCFRCNAALGQFDDVPERLRKAAEYLERHRGNDAS